MKPVAPRYFVLNAAVSFLIGAVVLATVSNTALAQPISASVTSYSYGGTSGINNTYIEVPWSQSSNNSDSWNGVPQALTASSSVSDPTNPFVTTYIVSDNINANWSPSSNSGTIRIDDSYNLIGTNGLLSYTSFADTAWSYTFIAEATGQVGLNFQNSNPLAGVSLFTLSGPFSPSNIDLYQGSTESFTGSVIAGQQYTLEVQDTLIISKSTADQGPQEFISDFSFTLPGATSSVPDTASTLPLLGGALAGLAALRRRFAK